MALTDTAVRNAKPKDKPYKLSDAQGLFLLVQPGGGRLWRLKYRIDGKEKKLALGVYPDTSLAQARLGRDEARKLLAVGIDPGLEKARRKLQATVDAGNTFDLIAKEFIAKRTAEGWSEATIGKAHFLMKYLSPALGKMPVADTRGSACQHIHPCQLSVALFCRRSAPLVTFRSEQGKLLGSTRPFFAIQSVLPPRSASMKS